MKNIFIFKILLIIFFTITQNAEAQIKAQGKKIPETHKPIKEILMKKIQEASIYLQNPEESSLELSLKKLNETPTNELNDYEISVLHHYKAIAYSQINNTSKMIEELELIVNKNPDMYSEIEVSALYKLSQAHFKNSNYIKSLEYLLKWTEYAKKLEPNDYRLAASLYEKTGDLNNAIINMEECIKNTEMSSFYMKSHHKYLANLYKKSNKEIESEIIINRISALPDATHPTIIRPTYTYPKEALNKKIEGYCTVTFSLTEKGTAANVRVLPGDCKTTQGKITNIFTEESIRLVSMYKFLPYIDIESSEQKEFHNIKERIEFKIQ